MYLPRHVPNVFSVIFQKDPEDLPSPSGTSDHADLLAQIEEEMGTEPKDLDVSVDNPEKVIKTMESYIAFTVKTKVFTGSMAINHVKSCCNGKI